MCSDRRIVADQILRAIDYGNLPKTEIERRIKAILDEELNIPMEGTVNMLKVDLCNSLLWQLYTHGEIDRERCEEEFKGKVSLKYNKYRRRKKLVLCGTRFIVLTTFIFLTASILKNITLVHLFRENSSEDGKQYIVSHYELSGQNVAKAIESHNYSEEISTQSQEELRNFLGFEVVFPDVVSESYYPEKYYSSILPDYVRVYCQYGNTGGERNGNDISVVVTLFTSADEATIVYEQDDNGEQTDICGLTVYKYSNDGRTRYMWRNGNAIVNLSVNSQIRLSGEEITEILTWGYEK